MNHIQITSTKHPKSLISSPYLTRNNISIKDPSAPRIIFEGTTAEAINKFPANVNVSITLSLAGLVKQTKVRIVADPNCQKTPHEMFAEGNFGNIRTATEGGVAPGNQRTGHLAILSSGAGRR